MKNPIDENCEYIQRWQTDSSVNVHLFGSKSPCQERWMYPETILLSVPCWVQVVYNCGPPYLLEPYLGSLPHSSPLKDIRPTTSLHMIFSILYLSLPRSPSVIYLKFKLSYTADTPIGICAHLLSTAWRSMFWQASIANVLLMLHIYMQYEEGEECFVVLSSCFNDLNRPNNCFYVWWVLIWMAARGTMRKHVSSWVLSLKRYTSWTPYSSTSSRFCVCTTVWMRM